MTATIYIEFISSTAVQWSISGPQLPSCINFMMLSNYVIRFTILHTRQKRTISKNYHVINRNATAFHLWVSTWSAYNISSQLGTSFRQIIMTFLGYRPRFCLGKFFVGQVKHGKVDEVERHADYTEIVQLILQCPCVCRWNQFAYMGFAHSTSLSREWYMSFVVL